MSNSKIFCVMVENKDKFAWVHSAHYSEQEATRYSNELAKTFRSWIQEAPVVRQPFVDVAPSKL